jgi:CheY-like chemotaxis protein
MLVLNAPLHGRLYLALVTIASNFRNPPNQSHGLRLPYRAARSVSLDAIKGARAESAPGTQQEGEMAGGSFGSGGVEKRGSVLLVEDEPLICELAAEALTEQGFEVESVDNAPDALQRLIAGSPIDILFTDVNLKGAMDGGTLARRARELRPDLPVVYTSGRPSAIQQLQPVEGSMFVPKPYNPFNVGPLLDYLLLMSRMPAVGAREPSAA